MANATYFDFMDAVASYYGTGSDAWLKISQMGVTPETLPLIQQIPGVSVTMSNNGNVLGYDLSNPFSSPVDPASVIDSNIQTGMYASGAFNANLPATIVTDSQTQEKVFNSGVKSTSLGTTVLSIADKARLAAVGVAWGTKFGKAIDETLYNIDPDWWDEHYPAINPQTWDSIATTEDGKSYIRSIFGINGNNTTMYMDERMAAYSYMTFLKENFWSTGIQPFEGDLEIGQQLTQNDFLYDYVGGYEMLVGKTLSPYYADRCRYNNGVLCYDKVNGLAICASWAKDTNIELTGFPFTVKQKSTDYEKTWEITPNYNLSDTSSGWRIGNSQYLSQFSSSNTNLVTTLTTPNANGYGYYPLIVKAQVVNPPGWCNPNPNASIQINPDNVINPTTHSHVTPNDDLADVLQALKNAYPDLFNDSVYEDIMQPDGTIERITYIPVPMPNTDANGNPITDMTPDIDPQTNPEVNPENRTSPYLQTLVDNVTTTPTTPDTGGGQASPIVTPTGSSSSLWAIYNPTQSELNNFGAWLWSSSFVEQIKKLFNDPMQAIIGVHKVFATPSTGSSANIKCGYVDSEISAKTVTSQYSSVDCGSVNLNEYFGNVFDYDPYTKVEIFLPFIGIVPLDLDYIMRSKINVKYTVDVLSGACIANIKVTRDGYGSVLFTYGGSAIVTYPISSGSYMGMISGALSLIAGVAGTIASGGVLAPAMLGAASGIGRMKTEVQHSGQFSGACGAMGGKKPYLIISRPQIRMANNVNQFEGIPSNTNVQLSTCTGYTKVKEVHLSIPGAYDSELQEIEQMLKDGIII